MNLDTNRILNTDSKVLVNALKELAKTENTIEAARKYEELYKDQPLSFIIDNSERIFVEPRNGLEFYRGMIQYFPLYTLCDELAKVTNYVHDHKSNMHPMLAESYGRLISALRNRIHDTNAFSTIEDVIIKKDPSYRVKIMTMCDLMVHVGDDHQHAKDNPAANPVYAERDRRNIENFNNLNKLVLSINPVESLIYICVHPRGGFLRSCARNIAKALENGSISRTMESAIYMSMLNSSDLFKEAVQNIPSMDARCILEGLAETDVIREFDSYIESYMADDTEYNMEVTLDNFIESAMAEVQDETYDAEVHTAKKGIATDEKLAIYESVLDIVFAMYEKYDPDQIMPEFPIFTRIKEAAGITGEITIEDALKVIVEATSAVESDLDSLMQEYTIDGRPGKVISKHNAGTKYNEDITKGVQERPKANAPTKSGASYDDDDENAEEIPQSSRLGSEGMPDSSYPNARKPQKPKQGILGKVTTKTMDANAAGMERTSKIKAAGQAVANAGKAVLKVPAGLLRGIGNFGKSLERMDDDRRKEYMIRPGFRKKIFKNIRVAAMYGATAYVNKMYLPITWFARKMSKEKNKRIRNDFASELETEIKVVEAKIEDANAKGDQTQRYQLIRIKDKLTRDLARVKYNSKYL